MNRTARLLVLVLLIVEGAAFAQTGPETETRKPFADELFSVALVTEDAQSGAELDGLKLSRVLYGDNKAPPLTGFLSLEYLSGDGEDVSRLGISFSILEAPGEKVYSFWVRPVLGVQYRDFRSGSRFDGFVGAGAEFILRPHHRVQLAVTYDRLLAFDGDESNQYGVAFRWGR